MKKILVILLSLFLTSGVFAYDEFLVQDTYETYYKAVNNKVFFYYAKVCSYVKMQDLIDNNGNTFACNWYYTYE